MNEINKMLELLSPEALERVKANWPELWNVGMVIKTISYSRNEVKIIPRYRDMNPDLSFWIDTSNLGMEFAAQDEIPIPVDLNIPYDGRMSWLQGKYWVDQWENPNFKPKVGKWGDAYLLRIDWGGPNDSSRGAEWDLLAPLALHSKRVSSKNGKMGINWYVFSAIFKYDPMEKDMKKVIEKLREGY